MLHGRLRFAVLAHASNIVEKAANAAASGVRSENSLALAACARSKRSSTGKLAMKL
jgi:hypothetical protein